MSAKKSFFTRLANAAAQKVGHPLAFLMALTLLIVWAVSGPLFHFSDTWQLVINTTTSLITFLMVFLIQNSQNRDSEAMQLKLDELIRALEGAHNTLLNLEELSKEDLDKIRKNYLDLAEKARKKLESGLEDTECIQINLIENIEK